MAGGSVMTVLGPVDGASLGMTSMHEHVLADGRCYLLPAEERPSTGPLAPDRPLTLANQALARRDMELREDALLMDDVEIGVAELADLREAGGGAVVEMSTPGLRVSAAALADISRRSGVAIVAGTGLYIRDSRPARFRGMGVEELEGWMVGEIEDGIDGSGVRAGHIGEIGVTDLDAEDVRLLEAAARAAERTGCSITVHPGFEPGSDGRAIAPVLERAGARPERVILGHGDAFIVTHDLERLIYDPDAGTVRIDYHRELLQRGYNVAFDCFGHDWGRERDDWVLEADWQRLAALVRLLREGYESQLVLGCDVFLRTLQRRGGGLGYTRLLDWLAPALRRHGVEDRQVRALLVDNPARLLAPG